MSSSTEFSQRHNSTFGPASGKENATNIKLSTSDPVKTGRAPIYQPPTSLEFIFKAPAEQLLPERLLIYSLIFSLRPKHCLEIGTHWGGSASIICNAMDDAGQGHLICIDPRPMIAPETWEKIKHRVDLLEGESPHILPQAHDRSGASFDFVLIDGDHTYEGVLRDIEGILPYLAKQAYLLFHDSHNYKIKEAIDEALRRYPSQLHDAGDLSSSTVPENRESQEQPVTWGGLRLLRFTQNHVLSPEQAQTMEEQLNSLQAQLWLTQEKLSLIENTRTWQLGSKLAYSPFGRLLIRLVKRFWP